MRFGFNNEQGLLVEENTDLRKVHFKYVTYRFRTRVVEVGGQRFVTAHS